MQEVVKALVDRHREQVIKRLPTYMSAEHFFQLCRELDRDPKIRRVAERNPDSVMSAILKSADCGLLIGGPFGHCWIAPFGEEVALLIGWRGFVFQWIHAGAVLKVVSNCVYVGDEIEVIAGDTEAINHRPSLTDKNREDPKWIANKDNIIGSYAIAWLPTGLKQYRWCSKGQIEMARARSQNASGPAWTHSYPAMAAKTAVRRLDGLIQVCGPTEQNKEAWDRYARTIELDRKQFDHVPDEKPDDLPGQSTGRVGPPTGATAGTEHDPSPDPPPPHSEGRKRSVTGPSLVVRDPEPEPEDAELITSEQQDQAMELMSAAGMRSSALIRYVNDTYDVPDIAQLTSAQAAELIVELGKRAKAK